MKSKFRKIHLLRLVLTVIFLPILFYQFFNLNEFSDEKNLFFSILPFLIIFSITLSVIQFTLSFKTLKLSEQEIEVSHVFPILSKSMKWRRVDYYVKVKEKNNDALWLVEDQKVKVVISSNNYANYNELERFISKHIEGGKYIRTTFIDHFLVLFGYQIKRLPNQIKTH